MRPWPPTAEDRHLRPRLLLLGPPGGVAIALETLKVYEDENILAHVKSLVPQFQKALHGYDGHPHVVARCAAWA